MTDPYSVLASGYDAVMAHVDYPMWAAYVQGLIRKHRPGASSLVELGCGTGTFAVSLQPHGPDGGYDYRAFDGAAPMVEVARERAAHAGRPIAFDTLAFGEPVPGPPADVVVLLYDGLNYLLTIDEVQALFVSIRDALAPGGIAIVDQSTVANSETHAAGGFDDAGETDAFSYLRTSRYDPEARLHTTTFDLTLPDGRQLIETHVQRAYALDEVRGAFEGAGLTDVAAYDDFTDSPADEHSERVHWVLRRAARGGRAA